MTDRTIRALEQQIRACISSARVQHVLLKNASAWNQLCSSLDVIGDTEFALDAFTGMPQPSDSGSTYILVYGLLQALVLQQDAVRHLSEAVDLPFVPDPLLGDIREIRNSSVGHPTKRWGEPRSHFISRATMSTAGFQLLTVRPDHGPAEFRSISIPTLIATQRAQLRAVLENVLQTLRARDDEHKAMFRDEKLADAFPATIDYDFEKLYESAHGSMAPELCAMHLGRVAKSVGRFKALLAERGSSGAYDSLEYHVTLIEYPISELASYFANVSGSRLNAQDANIFIHFLQGEVGTLRAMAAEIDESYSGGDGGV